MPRKMNGDQEPARMIRQDIMYANLVYLDGTGVTWCLSDLRGNVSSSMRHSESKP